MSAPEPEPPSEPARSKSAAGEALAIGLGFLLALGGVAWWLTRSSEPESGRSKFEKAEIDPNYARYVGDRSCRECHPGESAAHSRSGHSRTLRLASRVESARKLDGREVEDPERPGVSWRFDLREGRLSADRRQAGDVERFPIEYAFGSGRHAMTFATLLDRDPASPTLLEHRLTRFAHSGSLALTPGQLETTGNPGNTPHGRVFDGWNTIKCFSCHATVTSDRGPSFLDEATMIPNISCERCHGPAKGHVEAARRGAKGDELATSLGLGGASAREQMRLCGECHRLPEMVTPGDIRVDNAALVRHQPVGLMQSACFLEGDGQLSCSTCHDPHARASTDRAAYQAVCLACHREPEQTACPVSPRDGCVGCHMPRRDVGRGMMMSDHWIRVIPGTDPRASAPNP
jgi:hypothetical protein